MIDSTQMTCFYKMAKEEPNFNTREMMAYGSEINPSDLREAPLKAGGFVSLRYTLGTGRRGLNLGQRGWNLFAEEPDADDLPRGNT